MAEIMGESAGDIFGKKYFGIPFQVILVGVVGVAFVAKHLINSKKNAATVDSTAPATEGYATDVSGNKFASAYTGQAGGVPFGSGSLTNAVASGASAVTPATEINNEGWLRRATEKLNLLGQWNVTDIQTALQTYISGKPLDQRQAAIVQQAVKVEGLAPVNVNPGTVSGTGTKVMRYLNPAGTPSIFAEFSDGSVRWIQDPQQFAALVAANPDVPQSPDVLAISDPIWSTSDVYQSKSTDYLRTSAGYKGTSPAYSPYDIYSN